MKTEVTSRNYNNPDRVEYVGNKPEIYPPTVQVGIGGVMAKSLFERCYEIDVSDITKKNYNGLNYISWACAWARLKTYFHDAKFEVMEFRAWASVDVQPMSVPYLKTPEGFEVRVTVTLEGQSQTARLPVMDNKMNAMKECDMRDINDTTMRCLVKAMALHGFGLKVYEGEDFNTLKKLGLTNETKFDPRDGEYKIPFKKYKDLTIADAEKAHGLDDMYQYIQWVKEQPSSNHPKTLSQLQEFEKHLDVFKQARDRLEK